MNAYPHMCRDGHTEIGHRDSEHEQCPLCRAYAQVEDKLQFCRDLLEDLDGEGSQRGEFLATLRGRVQHEIQTANRAIKSIA